VVLLAFGELQGDLRDLPAVHQQKPDYVGHQNVAQLAEHTAK